MTRQPIAKQILFFIFGTFINIVLFSISKYLGFPFWTDYTGSFFITAFAGIIPGILSVIFHTALLFVLIDGPYALLMLLPTITICTIITLFVSKGEFETAKGYTLNMFISSVAATVVNFLIILIFGMSGRYAVYENAYAQICTVQGVVCGTLTITVAITAIETLISFIILGILLFISPKRRDGLTFK